MDTLSFQRAINTLKTDSICFWKHINPSFEVSAQLRKLLEMYAMSGQWEKIVS
ncbi:MAG: hypothetical protein K2X39_08435 [Silvanigrellaceae bacterium]|nr:hypothetical protein [Silvanigrellaceae bacterium]